MGAGAGAGIDALVSGKQVIYVRGASPSKVTLHPILTSGRRGVLASLGF
jgi:hypothetical protein